MGIIEGLMLIIMCLIKMASMCMPTIITLISVQAIVYRLTRISLYNNIMNLILRRI